MNNTTEQRAADTILQKPFFIRVGDKQYQVARLTPATLIAISPLVAQLPNEVNADKNKIVPFIIHAAEKYYPIILRIASILIVGVKKQQVQRKNKFIFKLFSLISRKSEVDRMVYELATKASNEEVFNLIAQCLSYQSIGFFLNTIISLTGANILEPTKTGATTSGE